MKTTVIVMGLALSLGVTSVGVAASKKECPMPPASKCFMMPSSNQNSRENLVWIGPACCYTADNIKADVSSQNTKRAATSAGNATAEKVGTTMITYSEKGGDTKSGTVEVTR